MEFDEEWAKEPPKGEAEEERAEAEAAAPTPIEAAKPPAEEDGDAVAPAANGNPSRPARTG